MTTYVVTRHPGAQVWLQEQGFADARLIEHLDPAMIEPGDIVVGTLPVHLAASVCERGAKYLHLTLNVPFPERGRELSAEDLQRYGAKLTPFFVREIHMTP